MKGLLFYDEAGAKRNEWFIRRLQTLAEQENMELELRIFYGEGDLEELKTQALPEFALVRCIAPQLNAALEALGVRVYNNAKTSKIANDKWETFAACRAWNIPVLETELFGEGVRYSNAALEFPCVCKTTDGHGGKEVFWINDEEDLQRVQEQTRGRRKVLQKPNSILGKDVRVYAVGGEILAAVARSSETDFRSNFSLGGRVELVEPDAVQSQIVKTLYEKLKFDFVGVDFLPTQKGWVLNEIEDAAGARMLYKSSDIDFAAQIIKRIKQTQKA